MSWLTDFYRHLNSELVNFIIQMFQYFALLIPTVLNNNFYSNQLNIKHLKSKHLTCHDFSDTFLSGFQMVCSLD